MCRVWHSSSVLNFNVNAQFIRNILHYWEDEFVGLVMNSKTTFTNTAVKTWHFVLSKQRKMSLNPLKTFQVAENQLHSGSYLREPKFWSVGSVFCHVSLWSPVSWLIIAREHKSRVWTVTPHSPPSVLQLSVEERDAGCKS